MENLPDHIEKLLAKLHREDHLRSLPAQRTGLVDFCSNDYLGFAARTFFLPDAIPRGSTGSRLLTGNHPAHTALEEFCSDWLKAPASLFFSSGYLANLALLTAVPRRGDTLLFDELCHASIRDGLRLSPANSIKFRHNDPEDLRNRIKTASGQVYIVTEALFSMDGDTGILPFIDEICRESGAWWIVDEAHSTGILGPEGSGLVNQLDLAGSGRLLARIHTFGKAPGRSGAVICGATALIDYLVNRARPFIYTTAPSPHAAAELREVLKALRYADAERGNLRDRIADWTTLAGKQAMAGSPIQKWIVPGNTRVKQAAEKCRAAGLDVRPILSPTVPAGSERIRLILHSFNTRDEVSRLYRTLSSGFGN